MVMHSMYVLSFAAAAVWYDHRSMQVWITGCVAGMTRLVQR
jgi:hypothetical protein